MVVVPACWPFGAVVPGAAGRVAAVGAGAAAGAGVAAGMAEGAARGRAGGIGSGVDLAVGRIVHGGEATVVVVPAGWPLGAVVPGAAGWVAAVAPAARVRRPPPGLPAGAMDWAGFRTLSMAKTAPLEASMSARVTVAPSMCRPSPVPSSWTWVRLAVWTPPLAPLIWARVHVGDDHMIEQQMAQLLGVGGVHQPGAVGLGQGREGRVGRGEDGDRRARLQGVGQLGRVERGQQGRELAVGPSARR